MNLRYVRTQKLRTCIIVQSRYVLHRVLHPASSALHRSRSVWLSAPSISPPLHDDSPHPAPRHTSYKRCDLTATAANASCAAAARRDRLATPLAPPVSGSLHQTSSSPPSVCRPSRPPSRRFPPPFLAPLAERTTRADLPDAVRDRDGPTAGETETEGARRIYLVVIFSSRVQLGELDATRSADDPQNKPIKGTKSQTEKRIFDRFDYGLCGIP